MTVPFLVAPSPHYRESWLESLEEWGTRDQDGASVFLADRYGLNLHEIHGFNKWVDLLNNLALETFQPLEGFSNQTSLWVVEGSTYLGAVSLRHALSNKYLADVGGHVGYGIRPSARRRGSAKLALRGALDEARSLGLDRVLVTCLDSNLPSALTIESCGGALESTRPAESFDPSFGVTEPVRRYWIPV
ncbi:GNAT family N-acetyltransferase [Paenarthrobacter sp. NPDC058040]|uniref:GNAT family N-acetyltransferase n=1 Tax=unclassified Paenarthrobacter TaxID=2634190 RepID=UPI0036DB6D19